MTAQMVAALDAQSAVAHYIAEQRRRSCRDLIRDVLTLHWQTLLDEDKAARVLWASGIGITLTEVQDTKNWLDDLEPYGARARAESEADQVGYLGNVDDAEDRIRSTAQHDLDSLVDRLVRDAAGVQAEVAILAIVNVLAGD